MKSGKSSDADSASGFGTPVEGRLSRGLKLGGALLGALSRSRGAERLTTTLGNLKGLSMKLGQTLSYVDFDASPQFQQTLSRLQQHSPPMPPEVVARVVREDLGRPPDEIFAHWQWQPAAAASVGQVHRARLHSGQEVAVKVRYPQARQAIEQDLQNLSLVSHLGGLLAPGMDRPALLAELRERFAEECDYRREAEHQSKFADFFRDAPGTVVPEVYPQWSSERVLTTQWIEGKPFDAFARDASQAQRDGAATAIHNFAFRSIFDLHALNCDPHPGNYLFTDDAVAFLDFGCVRQFSAPLVQHWRAMLRAALERDRPRFRAAVVDLGLVDDPTGFDFTAHYRQYLQLIRPWLSHDAGVLDANFVSQSYRELLRDNPNRRRLKLPRELLFSNRLQWGLYSVLVRLQSEFPMRREILSILYGPGEEQPQPFSAEELQGLMAR